MGLRIALSSLVIASLLCHSAQAGPLTDAGKDLYNQGELSDAVFKLLQALGSDADPETYYYLGLSYYGLNTYLLAIDAFEQALQLYAEQAPVNLLYSLALAHYYANHLELAQDYFNRVINDARTPIEIRIQAEQQLLLSLRDQSTAYQQALEAYQSQNYDLALEAFAEVLKLIPDSAEIYYFMGISAYQKLDYKLARDYLERSIALEPVGEYADSARQNLEVVKQLGNNLPSRAFSGSVTLGSFGDSNVNYGDAGNNQVNARQSDSALQDLGSSLNINLNYAFNSVTNLRYNYLLNLYWGLNDSPSQILNSYDYNLQQHSVSLFHRIPIKDWIELYLDTHTNLQVLAGQPFFTEAGVRPTLTFYESERLITRAWVDLSTEAYTSFQERDNISLGLGIDQYVYLWNSRSWLRFGYRFGQVNARDNLRTLQQSGGGQVTEVEFRAANSRSQNEIGLGMAFPVGPIDFELGSSFDFLLYTQPDVYRQYRLGINPITGLPLPRSEESAFEKYREDTRLTFYANMEWPITPQWSLLGRYNRITNVSNITQSEIRTLTSRSYLKDVLEFSLRFRF